MPLIYIIPPYLLDTSLGAYFQSQLLQLSPSLSNVISTNSPYYAPAPQNIPVPQFHFSSDPIMHQIIREKLVYKLQILGVLGADFSPVLDEELYDLYSIYSHKLLSQNTPKPVESPLELPHSSSHSSDKKSKRSLMESDTLGEVSFLNSNVPAGYEEFLSKSLRELLVIAKLESTGRFSSGSSFLKFDDVYFDYDLPTKWVLMIPNANLNLLKDDLSITTDFNSGFADIDISTIGKSDGKLPQTSHYYNFITDKPVIPSAGIFYYEVEINQEITYASDMNSLLSKSPVLISSKDFPLLCLGFVKRLINFDLKSSSSPPSEGRNTIDLSMVKDDLIFDQDNSAQRPLNASLETLLDAKPGEFKGSFALDLSDSNFYNSIKGSESAQRTTILTMSRRLSSLHRQSLEELDSGKIDTEVTFSMNTVDDSKSKKVQKSDVVGFGINYLDLSLFITLNGVLITTVSKEELVSNNPLNDNLFNPEYPKHNSVYPMIGFKLNDVIINSSVDESTKLKIRTNLGFKDFQFNISNYVKNYKNVAQKNINLDLLSSLHDGTSESIEEKLFNINENSALLNNLIKGYLYTEGYIDTYNALKNDLNELKSVTEQKPDSRDDNLIIEKSHGVERNLIKKYFMQSDFDNILQLLTTRYQEIFTDDEGMKLLFEIKLYKLIYCLKIYIEKMLNLGSREFEFEFNTNLSTTELYNEAINLATELQQEYGNNKQCGDRINKVLVLILVTDTKGYDNLPHIQSIIDKYNETMAGLFDKVNKKILKGLEFNEKSNLETIVEAVNSNIERLTLDHCDTKFTLVNFCQDQLDL